MKSKVEVERRPLNVNAGIVGHVDHGKTSLVKALSTTLSTAALDKHPQSQARGITIDLGFSAVTLPMPTHLDLDDRYATDSVQLTLVDCPGHASFIRTMIGGASIIDMMILVVDAAKGVQAQTIESLVVGEITAERLVVVLNKIDTIPENDRAERLEEAEAKIRKLLRRSMKFASNVPFVRVAASVGGEKAMNHGATTSWGLDELKKVLSESLPMPSRDVEGPFFFAIDHCFPIKGQGSVVTGTCLRGRATVNQVLELPFLGVEKKVKSIQMFKKPAKAVACGDRAGICLAQLDSSTVERGLLAAPGSVPFIAAAVAKVQRVRYYEGAAKTDSKFHVTVGHTTTLATATFFGAHEIATRKFADDYKPTHDFRFQESLLGTEDDGDDPQGRRRQRPLLRKKTEDDEEVTVEQYCLLRFDAKVRCQEDALVIGSRLDVDDLHACRIAFFGRLKWTSTEIKDLPRLYKMKQKTAKVVKVENPNSHKPGVHYEVIAEDLFQKEANMQQFVGLQLQADVGDVGSLNGAYGRDGKFKVAFKPNGTTVKPHGSLYLRYKRYHFSQTTTKLYQDADCFFDPSQLPDYAKESVAASIEAEIADQEKLAHQEKLRATKAAKKLKKAEQTAAPVTKTTTKNNGGDREMANGEERSGKVERLKGDPVKDGRYEMVIAEGFFAPEDDQRSYVGFVVRGSNGDVGKFVGPFGKAGKSKVDFGPAGTSLSVGADLYLQP